METLLYGIIGLLILMLGIKILKLPIKLLFNGIFGVILLYIVNLIGAYFDFSITINIVNSLIAGIFGIPGVIFLIIIKLFIN